MLDRLIERWRAFRPPGTTLLKDLGPGLITGAADDDPSGIATYSQAGAQFGYSLLWTTALTIPLMIGIQLVSARIGWVTGEGIAANLRQHFPRPFMLAIVALLLVANTINLGADLGAMAEILRLMLGSGNYQIYLILIAVTSLTLQIWLPFPRYAPLLKLLTLFLLAYAAVPFAIAVPWGQVARGALFPAMHWNTDILLMIVALLGTTISPYLFFWQASQEAEEHRQRGDPPAAALSGDIGRKQLRRIRFDTTIGMVFSNAVAFFIMLTTAATLHAHGVHDIATTREAADALRPIAGDFAFYLYGFGLLGAGMLAVPVLAGTCAYAVAEVMQWPSSLNLTPLHARGFYAVLVVATLIGVVMSFNDTDPVKELYWAAVVNGVIAVPIMVALMLIVQRPAIMGRFAARARMRGLGWLATAVMAIVLVLLIGSML